jgi:ABC-type arginine transport system permease subunit
MMNKGKKFADLATIVTVTLLIGSSILGIIFGLVIALLIARPLKSVGTIAKTEQ